jgi:hypothetical protein
MAHHASTAVHLLVIGKHCLVEQSDCNADGTVSNCRKQTLHLRTEHFVAAGADFADAFMCERRSLIS